MTALEIVLLLIGIICVAVSFIFFMKLDGPESVQSVNVSLSDKQKEAIKGQISAVFKEQTDELTSNIEGSTRDALEHLSNEKIKELSEYSDTVLAEINKNHTEVMFLYDMLNEKSKEVHNNIRDLNLATEAANEAIAHQESAAVQRAEAEMIAAVDGEVQDEPAKPKTVKKTTAAKSIKTTESKTAAKSPAKTASTTRKRTTKPKAVDTYASTDLSVQPADTEEVNADAVQNVEPAITENDNEKTDKPISNENKKEAVLSLYNEGKSNVEIAKTLGIGVGEVKLVLDLFKGIK